MVIDGAAAPDADANVREAEIATRRTPKLAIPEDGGFPVASVNRSNCASGTALAVTDATSDQTPDHVHAGTAHYPASHVTLEDAETS